MKITIRFILPIQNSEEAIFVRVCPDENHVPNFRPAPDKTDANTILRSCAARAQNNLLCVFLSMCIGLLLLNRQGGFEK